MMTNAEIVAEARIAKANAADAASVLGNFALEYARKLGIAEANLSMIAALAEHPATNYAQTLKEIAALARQALSKTRGDTPDPQASS
jgi:hypothetical protein